MADFPIYRLVKGNTLSFTEMDDNLRWLSTNMSGSAVAITGSVIGMSGSVNIVGNVQIAGTASIGFIKSEGYSTGSNQLGDDTLDTQTLIGIVSVSGSMSVSGSTVINNLTGSLFGTSSWAVSASWAPSQSIDASKITTGSVTASVDVTDTAFSIVSASINLLRISSSGGVSIGSDTQATGISSHAEGYQTLAAESYSHAEGYSTHGYGEASHAEGVFTDALGTGSHAEGNSTSAIGNYSHAEGSVAKTGLDNAYYATSVINSIISLSASYGDVSSQFPQVPYPGLVLLDDTFADNIYGKRIFTISEVNYFGAYTEIGLQEPSINTSLAKIAYANDISSNTGDQTIPGDCSHAEGGSTLAIGDYSHAEGYATTALGNYQHVQGQFNILSLDQSAFIIGNGTDNLNRRNLVFASGSSFQVTGSLEVLGGITGSLFGTASYSNNSLSASYAISASYALSASYVSGSAAIVTNLTSSNDALINGVPVGKGLGSVASNIAIGRGALKNFTAAANSNNTAIGSDALFSASSGNYNTAVGSGALVRNGTGFQNTAVGSFTMFTNGSGSYNTAVGYSAMQLATGSFNTAIGNLALPSNTGSNNTAIGYRTMTNAKSATDNVAIGINSLGNAVNANYNTSIGSLSLFNASGVGFGTSSYNVAIGYEAARRTQGAFLYSASYGVFIGTDVRPLQDVSNNEIVIGYQAIGSGSNTVSIGNSSIAITQLQGSIRTTGAFTGSLFGTASQATALQNTGSTGFVSNMSDTYTGTAKITDIITLSAAEYSAIGAPLTSTLYIII